MCIVINKWKDFEPTQEYLSIISGLTSIDKLYQYSQKFKYVAEKGDHWKTPIEFIDDGGGDCEDWARWYVDVLVRIVGIKEARFATYGGYDKKRWGNKIYWHAICVLPYQSELALFSNNLFKTGYKDFVETGHYTFPDGLKYMEIRDWQGKVLTRKFKLFGTF